VSLAKRALEEAWELEDALRRPVLVPMTAEELAWFAEHPDEPEFYRKRRPGEFEALAEEEDLIGVTVVPIGGGLASIHPVIVRRFSDG
jgi:hypothetical protein